MRSVALGVAMAALLPCASAGESTGQPPGGLLNPVDACPERTDSPIGSNDLEHIRCLLRSGHRALGILLLQRRVAQDPSDREAANLLEEQHVASGSIPPVATPRSALSFAGWIAAEAGLDSNINRATAAKAIDIPLLNYRSLALPDLLVEQRSGFAGLQAGAALRLPVGASTQIDVVGQASVRANFAESSYLPHNYAIQARLEKAWDRVTLGVGGSAVQQWVAKYRMLERRGVRLHAGMRPLAKIDVTASADWAGNTYPMFDGLKTNESTQEIRIAFEPWRLQVGAYWGDEASAGSVKDLDRAFGGVRFGWQHPIGDRTLLAVDVATGRSDYRQFSRLFATQRKDRLTEFAVSLHYRFDRGWSITPKLTLERNDSSLALNGYQRAQVLAELRKDF